MDRRSPTNPCPCRGHFVLYEPTGSYDLCPVCYWEDDAVQLKWPAMAGGANRPSLVQAQANFAVLGASEEQWVERVRPPAEDERQDPTWRPVDPNPDRFDDTTVDSSGLGDSETLYYWLRSAAP